MNEMMKITILARGIKVSHGDQPAMTLLAAHPQWGDQEVCGELGLSVEGLP